MTTPPPGNPDPRNLAEDELESFFHAVSDKFVAHVVNNPNDPVAAKAAVRGSFLSGALFTMRIIKEEECAINLHYIKEALANFPSPGSDPNDIEMNHVVERFLTDAFNETIAGRGPSSSEWTR